MRHYTSARITHCASWRETDTVYKSCMLQVSHVSTVIFTPCAHAQKGKAIVLYVCRHENHHFGKSRDLGDSLASLFGQNAQNTAFSPLQIV